MSDAVSQPSSSTVQPGPKKTRRWWMRLASLTGLGALAGCGKSRWLSAGPGWKGPLTDHFNGKTFYHPWEVSGLKKSTLDFWRWQFTKQRVKWPEQAVDGIETPNFPQLVTDEKATVTCVGHATFLIQMAGLNVLTDPVWSERCSPVSWAGPKRVRPPGIEWEKLPEIHAVLVSHNHYDHCDLATLKRLTARFAPKIIVGLGNAAFLAQHGMPGAIELDWWQQHPLHPDLSITYTPAQHWSNRGGGGEDTTLWGGFYLAGPKTRRVYFAGDSGYAPCFRQIREKLGPPDLALLPIGAYEPQWFMKAVHMNPAEAIQAHIDLQAKQSLGIHHGVWQLTDEGMDAPLSDLRKAQQTQGLGHTAFSAAVVGKTTVI